MRLTSLHCLISWGNVMKDWNKEYQRHLEWRKENNFRGGYIPRKCLTCDKHFDLCHCINGHSLCMNEDNPGKVFEFCVNKETQITLFDYLKADV